VGDAVSLGARGVVLRARTVALADQLALAAALHQVVDPVGGVLIVAGAAGLVARRPANRLCERDDPRPFGPAVHLSADAPFPNPRPALVGRSCHSADEVARARAEGCDYAFVSPVYPTPSKPGYGPALGPAGLAALCPPGLPVYALGGVQPSSVAECLAAGAYGVAVMGPILRDPSLVPAYLKELPA